MIAELLAQAVAKSLKDNIPRLAAALAYYSIISLAPLLLIALVVAGLTLGEQTGQRQIAEQMQGVTGNTGGPIIQALINQANQPVVGVVATVLGAVVLFFGAGGVFVELRDSLNMIWEVKSNHVGIIQSMVRERFLSLVMVLGMCFLLVVVIRYWSTPAWGLQISPGILLQGSLRTRKPWPAHHEVSRRSFTLGFTGEGAEA